MKSRFLKGAIIIPLMMALFISQGRAEMKAAKEDMAKWKKGEAQWKRTYSKKWTAAELKRLRQEAIESQQKSPEDTVITIKKGDTLWNLADRYFRNPWLWPRLWAYDGNLAIENPHKITPGKRLIIPSMAAGLGRPSKEVPGVIGPPSTLEEDKIEASRLRQEIDVLKKIRDGKEERIAQLNKEIPELMARDIERERIRRELEGKLEDALTDRKLYERAVVSKKEMEIAQLSRDVEDLKEQIYYLENELAKKEAEIKEKEEIIKAQEATIGNQINQINRLSSDLDEERREMEQFFAFVGLIGGILALSHSN